jgi:hypothetical protein
MHIYGATASPGMCQVLNNFFNVYGIIDFFISPKGISGSDMEYLSHSNLVLN